MTDSGTPQGAATANVSDPVEQPSPTPEGRAHSSDDHGSTAPVANDAERAEPVLEGRLHELIEELEDEPEGPASKAQLRNIAVQIASVEESWTGPIPHPRFLREYNLILKDGAERIMGLTEREQAHRHDMNRAEQKVMDRAEQNDYTLARRGQSFGFAVCVLFGALAIWLIAIGKTVPAALILLGDLAAVVAVFVTGRRRKDSSGEA